MVCVCFKTALVFIFRCPKEVYPHVSTIINICLKYLTYDPNYNYDDEDEDENAMDADGGDDDDQGISNYIEGICVLPQKKPVSQMEHWFITANCTIVLWCSSLKS